MANSRTADRFQSLPATTLPTLRWTKISPGRVLVMVFTATRESEQPIHRAVGFCALASSAK